jgi:hypothetical protein
VLHTTISLQIKHIYLIVSYTYSVYSWNEQEMKKESRKYQNEKNIPGWMGYTFRWWGMWKVKDVATGDGKAAACCMNMPERCWFWRNILTRS